VALFAKNDLQLKAPYGSSPPCIAWRADFEKFLKSAAYGKCEKRLSKWGAVYKNGERLLRNFSTAPCMKSAREDFGNGEHDFGAHGNGVATISRLLKMIGLLCRISSLL